MCCHIHSLHLIFFTGSIRMYEITFCSTDINECEDPGDNPTCHENANCTDTEGSYECTCNTGFSGDGFICLGMND